MAISMTTVRIKPAEAEGLIDAAESSARSQKMDIEKLISVVKLLFSKVNNYLS